MKLNFLTSLLNKYQTDGVLGALKSLPDIFGKTLGRLVLGFFCSYVLASVCSAAALLVLVDYSLEGKVGAYDTADAAQAALPEIIAPNYFVVRKGVLNRNLFNSSGEVPDESNDFSDDDQTPSGEFSLTGPCVESKLPLKLSGTIFMGESSMSLASVVDTSASETDTYMVGDVIIDHPKARVVKIERKRVVINNAGLKECLEIDKDASMKEENPMPAVVRSEVTNKPPSGPPADGGAVVLTGAYVEEQIGEGFGKIIQAARLVPKPDESGGTVGFKIFAIKPGSILEKMGLKNGDIITKANDTSMKNPDQGFALYQALQDNNDIVVEVDRGGTPTTLKIQIK